MSEPLTFERTAKSAGEVSVCALAAMAEPLLCRFPQDFFDGREKTRRAASHWLIEALVPMRLSAWGEEGAMVEEQDNRL